MPIDTTTSFIIGFMGGMVLSAERRYVNVFH